MERLILTHWNKQTGPEPIIQYPPEKNFPPKETLVGIWTMHELDKENSMIKFSPEEGNDSYISIIQKFEGEIYFLILVYKKRKMIGDTIHESPDILALISKNLTELINTNKITRAISEAYNTIRNYSKLDEEENLISFFRDKIKFTILKILRDGVISKIELTNILRQDYGFSTINIDLILISFIRENLILKKNIPGSKDCYFLLRDLSCIRIPPNSLLKDQFEIKTLKKYEETLEKYFLEGNNANDSESKMIIQTVLLNKDVFLLLKTLREERISINECLNILNNNEDLFSELLEKNFIYESKGFVYPFTDVRFIKFYPSYLIKNLVRRYNDQEISLNEYTTHLKLLTEQLDVQLKDLDYEII
jgi:hypothetical protein